MPILINKTGFGYLDTVCFYCGKHAIQKHHLYPRSGPDFSNVLEYIANTCRWCNMTANDTIFETIGDSVDYVQNRLMEKGRCREINLPKVSQEVRRVLLAEKRSPLRDLASENSVTRLADMHTMRAYARKRYYETLEQKYLANLMCRSCSKTSWDYSVSIRPCSQNSCPLAARRMEAQIKIDRMMAAYDRKNFPVQKSA